MSAALKGGMQKQKGEKKETKVIAGDNVSTAKRVQQLDGQENQYT